MRSSTSKMCVLGLLVIWCIGSARTTDPDAQPLEQSERSGRSWHQSLFGPQMLMQNQQASTSQPVDSGNQQPNQQPAPDLNGPNRNFEEHDKNGAAVPAASEQDFMSRHFGYLNVHRFDPNMPYYDRNGAYPRFPSPHAPRFGPGYRKDKYGHGYGYSCKQGDDCDEVKAANQLAARQPAPQSPSPFHHQNPMAGFGNPYQDLSAFPSMPSFPNIPSFAGAYGNQFGAPARFNDPHPQPPMHQSMLPQSMMPQSMMPQSMMPHSMMPQRFYQGRYLHDLEDKSAKESKSVDKTASE